MAAKVVARLSLISGYSVRPDGFAEIRVPTDLTVNGRGADPPAKITPTLIVTGLRVEIEASPQARNLTFRYGLEGPDGERSHILQAPKSQWPDWFSSQLDPKTLAELPDGESPPLADLKLQANAPYLLLFPAALYVQAIGPHLVHVLVNNVHLRTPVDIKYRRLPDVRDSLI